MRLNALGASFLGLFVQHDEIEVRQARDPRHPPRDCGEELREALGIDAIREGRAELLLPVGPLEDGNALARDAQRLPQGALGVVGLVENKPEKYDVERAVGVGKGLGRPDDEAGFRNEPLGVNYHVRVGIDALHPASVFYKAFGEEPGARSDIECRGGRKPFKAPFDDLLYLQAFDAIGGAKAISLS